MFLCGGLQEVYHPSIATDEGLAVQQQMYSEEAASKASRTHARPTNEQKAFLSGSYELGVPEVPDPNGVASRELTSSQDAMPNHHYIDSRSSHLAFPSRFQHELVGLPTKVRIPSQSSLTVPSSKARHVTFSSREPHLDKATGNIEHIRVSPANMSPSLARQRFPQSFSYTSNLRSEQALNHTIVHGDGEGYPRPEPDRRWGIIDPNLVRSNDNPEEEHFVDGNLFFNHLVRSKAAEDYNMAEMLRERSRELQQQQLFRRKMIAPRALDKQRSPADIADRLSTSLPADYFASKRSGYHYYAKRDGVPGREVEEECRVPDSQEPLQDMSFADGLEIEIPPRRHGGLGGGGLRQSLSADQLLMVPHSHQNQSEFGRHYFRPCRLTKDSTVPLPYLDQVVRPLHVETKSSVRCKSGSLSVGLPQCRPVQTQTEPVQISSVPVKTKDAAHSEQHVREPTRDPVTWSSRPMASSFESVSNMGRYNVRTGQFEALTELEPKDLPLMAKQYRANSNSLTSQNRTLNIPIPPLSSSGVSRHVGYAEYPQRNVSDTSPTMQKGQGVTQWDALPAGDRGQRNDFVNRTWSAQMADRSLESRPTYWRDSRLSSSWDPVRFRTLSQHVPQSVGDFTNRMQQAPRVYLTSFQSPEPQEYPSPEDQIQGYDVSGRKAVTWQDQGEELSQPVASTFRLNLSRTHPSGNFQDNLGYSDHLDEASIPDETRSISREGMHYPSNDSLLRSLSVTDLHTVDQFALFEVSTSKLGWAESFMGTNWVDKMKQYKFVVVNRHEEVLFIGTEEDGSISNCILSPYKSSFKVRILDANGQDVIHFRRLYPVKPKTNFALGGKRKYRLEVSTPSGHVIGNVEKTYDSDTYYVLEDRAGECLFLIQRSCICTCPLFWDYEFKILLPSGEAEVGEISWSYLTAQNEQFNGTEISFPADLNMTSKIMLLGVCFLLNFSRWQSAYLDSVYNPRKRKDVATLFGSKLSPREENKEIAALLKTSPTDENGFHTSSQNIEDDIALAAN